MSYVRFVFPVAVLAALTFVLPAVTATSAGAADGDRLVERIAKARKKVWRWQDVMQRSRTKPNHSLKELRSKSTEFKERSVTIWERRVVRVRHKAYHPPHEREFRCIHRHEGAWTANTGNGYYGGLQMDLSFQRAYGPRLLRQKGKAHRWMPIEQIWVAEKAYRSGRGFHPWPNTARRCGLI